MVAGFEGTPNEGTRTRSSTPGRPSSLAPIGVISGSLTTLEILQGRGAAQRPVLRKRLASGCADDPATQATLAAVGHLGMRLTAPELVRTLAVKEGADGFVALEFVEGLDLAQLLRSARTPDCHRYVVPVVLDVLRALGALHALRSAAGEDTPVVHQAPVARHILVGTDGRARLCDLMHVLGPGLPATPERRRFLRPSEMSPEQASGSGHIDARSDLFAVGVVIWEWLTGERLFGAPSAQETLAHVMRMPIAPASERGAATSAFDGLCARALMRVRVGRYGTADELASELAALSDGRPEAVVRAEIGAWVQRTMELGGRDSQTLLKPSPAPHEFAARPSQTAPSREQARSDAAPRRAIVEIGPSSTGRSSDPRAELTDGDDDSSPTIARSDLFGAEDAWSDGREGQPRTPFDAATRARPGLSEQLAAELRAAEDAIEDEPTRAHRPGDDTYPRSLFTSEADAASPARARARAEHHSVPEDAQSSDSLALPSIFHDHQEPERDDPTTPRLSQAGGPRVISAVFGGPMPSVLGEGASWPEGNAATEPRLAHSLAAMDTASRRPRGWLWGALLGALVMVALFGLYVAFGGAGEGHDAPAHGPAGAPRALERPEPPLPAAESAPTQVGEARQPGTVAAPAATSDAKRGAPRNPAGATPVAAPRPAHRFQPRKPPAPSAPSAAEISAPAPAAAPASAASEVPENPY